MSVTKTDEIIGRTGLLDMGEMKVGVRVIDVKRPYGRLQYIVKPISGRGRQMVWASKVTLKGDAGPVEAPPKTAQVATPAATEWKTCVACRGVGSFDGYTGCGTCNGYGKVRS